MPFPISCTACGKSFSIPDDVYERRVAGKVVSIKCKACRSPIRVDGTAAAATPTTIKGAQSPMHYSEAAEPESEQVEPEREEFWAVDCGDQPDRELTTSELIAEIQTGAIHPNTLVWREGMENWQPVVEVDQLGSYVPEAALEEADLLEPEAANYGDSRGGYGEDDLTLVRSFNDDDLSWLRTATKRDQEAQTPAPEQPAASPPGQAAPPPGPWSHAHAGRPEPPPRSTPHRERLPTIVGQPPPPVPSLAGTPMAEVSGRRPPPPPSSLGTQASVGVAPQPASSDNPFSTRAPTGLDPFGTPLPGAGGPFPAGHSPTGNATPGSPPNAYVQGGAPGPAAFGQAAAAVGQPSAVVFSQPSAAPFPQQASSPFGQQGTAQFPQQGAAVFEQPAHYPQQGGMAHYPQQGGAAHYGQPGAQLGQAASPFIASTQVDYDLEAAAFRSRDKRPWILGGLGLLVLGLVIWLASSGNETDPASLGSQPASAETQPSPTAAPPLPAEPSRDPSRSSPPSDQASDTSPPAQAAAPEGDFAKMFSEAAKKSDGVK